ncbi:MAG: hypothetical protein ACRCZD_01715 [Phycicoccus sp.]
MARTIIAAVVDALAQERRHLALDGAWARYVGVEDGWSATPVRSGGSR